MKINEKVGAMVVAATAAAAVGTLAVGSADAATAAKTEYFKIGGTPTAELVVAHGAFTDGGKDDASHDNYDVLHLTGGTLRLTHPDKDAKYVPKVNAKTCFATFTITGSYTVGHGTGAYKNWVGNGKYTASGTAILERTKAGVCSMNAEPRVEIFEVSGSGPAHKK